MAQIRTKQSNRWQLLGALCMALAFAAIVGAVNSKSPGLYIVFGLLAIGAIVCIQKAKAALRTV